jgi:hypothetical protein
MAPVPNRVDLTAALKNFEKKKYLGCGSSSAE